MFRWFFYYSVWHRLTLCSWKIISPFYARPQGGETLREIWQRMANERRERLKLVSANCFCLRSYYSGQLIVSHLERAFFLFICHMSCSWIVWKGGTWRQYWLLDYIEGYKDSADGWCLVIEWRVWKLVLDGITIRLHRRMQHWLLDYIAAYKDSPPRLTAVPNYKLRKLHQVSRRGYFWAHLRSVESAANFIDVYNLTHIN